MRRLALFVAVCWLVASAPAMSITKTDQPIQLRAPLAVGNLVRGPLVARQALRSPALLLNINKQLTIEGFYYDGSIPMIINDMSLLQEDGLLPPDSYVPIVGVRPTGIKWGDRLSLTGILERPTGVLSREPAVIRINNAANIRIVTPTAIRFRSNIRIIPGAIIAAIAELKAPYAVLIAGGATMADNHIRYWNDLSAMYSILRSKGYPASHITVIYAGGIAKDGSMPVNYSATKANIATAFTNIASRTSTDNDVYIMLNDHGSSLSGGHTGLCLWYETMSDSEFATQVNKITSCKHMLIQTKQCFSGGFVDDLTKPNRVVMSSSTAGQVSWAKSTLDFGEFTYWYMSALKGSFVDGAGPVNADTSGDGKVSIMEAWNYARAHDGANEIPQYEDNGTLSCASGGSMPRSGEGALGAACWLQ